VAQASRLCSFPTGMPGAPTVGQASVPAILINVGCVSRTIFLKLQFAGPQKRPPLFSSPVAGLRSVGAASLQTSRDTGKTIAGITRLPASVLNQFMIPN
jgi:hypothetical protein